MKTLRYFSHFPIQPRILPNQLSPSSKLILTKNIDILTNEFPTILSTNQHTEFIYSKDILFQYLSPALGRSSLITLRGRDHYMNFLLFVRTVCQHATLFREHRLKTI